jgi:KUP system potassium uptake protein
VDEFHESDITTLDDAFAEQVVYFVGMRQLKVSAATKFFPRYALQVFIWLRGLSGSRITEMDISLDYVFEVGIVKEI